MGRYSYDRRRQTLKNASNEDWQAEIVDIQERAEKFLSRAQGRPEVLIELGTILETPAIVEQGRRATQRITDVRAILLIAKSANDDISDTDDEFTNFSKELTAKGGVEGVTQRDIESRLPRLHKLRALSEEAKKILGRLKNEPVDWNASEWLGEKVVLYKELKRKAPNERDFDEWDNLTEGIDTALESYTRDHLQELVEENTDKR